MNLNFLSTQCARHFQFQVGKKKTNTAVPKPIENSPEGQKEKKKKIKTPNPPSALAASICEGSGGDPEAQQ